MGNGPFVIAVYGADEVATQLDELLPGLEVQGRPAQVRRVTSATELEGVHILYIGPASEECRRTTSAHAEIEHARSRGNVTVEQCPFRTLEILRHIIGSHNCGVFPDAPV